MGTNRDRKLCVYDTEKEKKKTKRERKPPKISYSLITP
jgi:hypothetical protein